MDPITTNDIILLPGILVFFGAFVYAVAFANGLRDHVVPRYRWIGFVLVFLAVLIGVKYVARMLDSNADFYKSMITSRKAALAHYVSLAMPLAVLGVMAGMEAWFKRYQRSME